MTRSIVPALAGALFCLALPLSVAAQTPSPAPVASPGPPQIAFPGQYAPAPAYDFSNTTMSLPLPRLRFSSSIARCQAELSP